MMKVCAGDSRNSSSRDANQGRGSTVARRAAKACSIADAPESGAIKRCALAASELLGWRALKAARRGCFPVKLHCTRGVGGRKRKGDPGGCYILVTRVWAVAA